VEYTPPPTNCDRLAGSETVQDALDILCEGPARRITAVKLGAMGPPLLNDGSVTVDQLRDGVHLVCDDPIDPRSIKRATSFVTVEVPLGVGSSAAAYDPRVLAADLTQNGSNIVWMLTAEAASRLEQQLADAESTFAQRALLARLTVQGNYVWGAGDPLPYLDGDTFGSPAETGADPPVPLTPEDLPPTRLRVLDGGKLSLHGPDHGRQQRGNQRAGHVRPHSARDRPRVSERHRHGAGQRHSNLRLLHR